MAVGAHVPVGRSVRTANEAQERHNLGQVGRVALVAMRDDGSHDGKRSSRSRARFSTRGHRSPLYP